MKTFYVLEFEDMKYLFKSTETIRREEEIIRLALHEDGNPNDRVTNTMVLHAVLEIASIVSTGKFHDFYLSSNAATIEHFFDGLDEKNITYIKITPEIMDILCL